MAKPGHRARSILDGKEIKINRVKEVIGARSYINTPGQILGKIRGDVQDNRKVGFFVKTKDTFVEVVDYEYDGKIKIGSRFTPPPTDTVKSY